MTKVAALELAKYNIRVNSVHPGMVLTPMTENAPKDWAKKIINGIPMKRLARAEEISNMVLFLASDESSYSTGVEFIADGGVVAGK
jgi:3alpha(or 20beta)-hydroxysteroid dehydrogenase